MAMSYHEMSRISTVERAAVTVFALGGTMRALLALSLVSVVACGQKQLAATGSPQQPYTASRTTVIGTDSSGNAVSGSTSEQVVAGDCVTVGSQCVDTTSGSSGGFCQGGPSGGPVDSIVVDGKVVTTVCYPPGNDGKTTVVSGSGNVNIPQNANNTTITFDPSTDGNKITGDVTVAGNNVAIYGDGADKTIIDGNVTLTGNNARIRGLTITGDLILQTNNTAAVLVKVLGNVQVLGENDVFTAGDVFGDVSVTKNNVVLVSNRAQGTWNAAGGNADCVDNKAFTDKNSDDLVEASEVGADLTCDGTAHP
jgi:hypothetical protein